MSSNYSLMCRQLSGFMEITRNPVSTLANASAILYQGLDRINWAGFYIASGENLLLGPFQGKPACLVIPKGKGVCGKAMETLETQRVDNVHEFPGHIACDCASNSEIVIPLVKNSIFLGVLDIDSPVFARFSKNDETGLISFCRVLIEADFTRLVF